MPTPSRASCDCTSMPSLLYTCIFIFPADKDSAEIVNTLSTGLGQSAYDFLPAAVGVAIVILEKLFIPLFSKKLAEPFRASAPSSSQAPEPDFSKVNSDSS